MADVHVKGLRELQAYLDKVPARMEANILRSALRAGMNVVYPVAQAKIRSRSGLLAKGLKIGTRIRYGKAIANLKVTGPHAFVAKWVEFGTKAHNISAKGGGFLSFGGIFSKSVRHPGARPQPFMRPALDSQAQNAVVAVGEHIKRKLSKKHGLDVGHIRIEGDE